MTESTSSGRFSIDEPLEIEMILDLPPLLFIPKNYYAY